MEVEMDGTCSTHGRKLLLENVKRKDHLGDLCVDWRIILKHDLKYRLILSGSG
jgi:hypothetical protein